jgi:hypothetical protein
MIGKAGLKAGLIGAAVILVVTLLSQILQDPGYCRLLTYLTYAAIGALAGFFCDPPRTAGSGAAAGAIAGLISGMASVASGLIWGIIQVAVAGPENLLSTGPEMMRELTELGNHPEALLEIGGIAFAGCLCCLGGLAADAGLGAVGGLIFAALRPE